MNPIEGNLSIRPGAPVGGKSNISSVQRISPAARAADTATFASSAAQQRAGAPHAAGQKLARAGAAVDVASFGLERTQSLLVKARDSIGTDEFDGYLRAIDEHADSVTFEGVPLLREGAVVTAGGDTMHVRPMTTMDLGAIVESGRSFRLYDTRHGGALDARINPSAAQRSTGIAIDEVTAARTRLDQFRQGTIGPARVSAAAQTVGLPVNEGAASSAAMGARGLLLSGGAAGALRVSSPEAVLSLLSPRPS